MTGVDFDQADPGFFFVVPEPRNFSWWPLRWVMGVPARETRERGDFDARGLHVARGVVGAQPVPESPRTPGF